MLSICSKYPSAFNTKDLFLFGLLDRVYCICGDKDAGTYIQHHISYLLAYAHGIKYKTS